MAKYVFEARGNFEEFVEEVKSICSRLGASITQEDEHYFNNDVVVLVYERYSIIGSNRVSLNITIVKNNGLISLVAITSGGSQAMLFKINTLGEDAFLNDLKSELAKL